MGLHHVCFREKTRDGVDELHEVLLSINAHVAHPPQNEEWIPGHYSVLFEDPDGIRIEVNIILGKGFFAEQTESK